MTLLPPPAASPAPSRSHRIREAVLSLVFTVALLSITIAISPGIDVSWPPGVLIAAALCMVVGAVVRPLLVRVLGPFGWCGAFVLAFLSGGIVMYVAIELAPGIEDDGFGSVLIASWIYGVVVAAMEWLFLADRDDAFLAYAIRQARRRGAPPQASIDEPGVVFVQLDGVPYPVLELGIRSGTLPTLASWVRGGTHVATEWTARVPCTTPVSQAGLLHGTTQDMPAFRWYEKDSGHLFVANHPPDAVAIETRLSDGRGLLADGGVSISNLFSGDAPLSLLTMSGMRGVRGGLGPSRSYAAFFTHPYGFVRALARTVGEMVKELYQRRRQRLLGVVPRIDRRGAYVALRGVTNALLRDLNVALVTEAMMNAAPSIYVDFVDYDEIAHHAGVVRPESLRSLEGLDGVLRLLEQVAEQAPRPYRFVVLSDHGQSQGSTFRQRTGTSLDDVIRELTSAAGDEVSAATGAVEGWGPVNVFLSQLGEQRSVTGSVTRRLLRSRVEDGAIRLGPSAQEESRIGEGRPEVVVVGSGNLGGVWFTQHAGRLMVEDLEVLHPGLLAGLTHTPGIGFVVADTGRYGPVAIGPGGVHHLVDGTVEGSDPLEAFGPYARADLLHVAQYRNAPDLYVNSAYDPHLDEVAAFEELVGCHGGLGGWQTRAVLVHPADWRVDEDLLTDGTLRGAETVHRQLVRWLRAVGQRASIDDPR